MSKFLRLYADGVNVSVTKVASGRYAGAFQVLVQDSVSGANVNAGAFQVLVQDSVSGANVNADFDVLVP